MKKIIVVLIVLAAAVWIVTWFRAPEEVAKSAAEPWPAGMGGLDAVDKRVPQLQANAASKKLTALVNALPKSDAPVDFVAREIARGNLTIGVPPQLPDVTAIRELALREPIVWQRQEGIDAPGLVEMRTVELAAARVLVAAALAKAREGNGAAWDDLSAAWKLARTLDPHPQVMAQTAALTTARMINGVAWKMPMPAPAWLREVHERDHVRPLLEAFQFQSASYWKDGAQMFPTKWLASQVEHDRAIAEDLAKTTRCDVTAPMNELGVDLSSVWRRAFRYRAEREASVNALRVRDGKPIEPGSQCSDGAWTLDGTTLRFSREITTAPPDRPLPLTLRVQK